MTNATKTVGGAIASSIFAIALAVDGLAVDGLAVDGLAADGLELEQASAPLSGYLTVWAVCAGAALLAAVALSVAPQGSFSERAVEV